MIGLVEALDGSFALDDVMGVTNVPARPGRAERYLVELRSGNSNVQLFKWEYADLKTRAVQIIPAAPDTFVIRSYPGDEDEVLLDTLPVLAWAICFDGQTRAILPTGVNVTRLDPYCPEFAKTPGGIFELGREAEPDRFADEQEVLDYLRPFYRRQRDRKAAEAEAAA